MTYIKNSVCIIITLCYTSYLTTAYNPSLAEKLSKYAVSKDRSPFVATKESCGAAIKKVNLPYAAPRNIKQYLECMENNYRDVAEISVQEYNELEPPYKETMDKKGIRVIAHLTSKGSNALMFTPRGTKDALKLFLGDTIKMHQDRESMVGHDYTFGKLLGYSDEDIQYYFATRGSEYKQPGCGTFEDEKNEGDAWMTKMDLFIDQLNLAQ